MADNTTLPGTGDVIAADDIGGVKYQRVKAAWGADGTANDVTAATPLPVAANDCVELLNTTVSAVGNSSSIDTLGYGAVVVQLSGVWQGSCYFEASNDNTNWDTVLVFSRDNLSLQDVVTSSGLYTIRPSGRYLRLVTTNITGTITVLALGRAAEGISAVDLLSLAMDKANNVPLNVALMGTKQDAQGALVLSDCAGPFYASASVASGTNGVLTIDTQGYPSLTLSGVVGSGSVQVWFSDDGRSWCNVVPATYASGSVVGLANGGTAAVNAATTQINQWPCVGRYAQIRVTAVTTPIVVMAYLRMQQCPNQVGFSASAGTISVNTTPVAGTTLMGDVGIQNRANATGAATISKFTAAATTNAASIKASAGRVVGFSLTNTTASVKYFRFFNKASAPTMGTDSPVFVVPIPANGRAELSIPGGIGFATGIAIACTGAVADLDTTATAASDVLGAFFYA